MFCLMFYQRIPVINKLSIIQGVRANENSHNHHRYLDILERVSTEEKLLAMSILTVDSELVEHLL